MNIEILIPLTFLLVVFGVIKMLIDYQFKKQQALQQTLQSAISQGLALPEQTWQWFIMSVDPKRKDLRRAIQFFVMATLIAALAFLIPFQDPQGQSAVFIVAAFPLSISLLHFGFWLFWYPRLDD